MTKQRIAALEKMLKYYNKQVRHYESLLFQAKARERLRAGSERSVHVALFYIEGDAGDGRDLLISTVTENYGRSVRLSYRGRRIPLSPLLRADRELRWSAVIEGEVCGADNYFTDTLARAFYNKKDAEKWLAKQRLIYRGIRDDVGSED
ncbi:hypothetical protein D6827_02530 [Candidatus Parcubacteria bacterium]|nr:MAG: hypothetical protein D6827_02530 [Candidatus Parcubacteria bacterium]